MRITPRAWTVRRSGSRGTQVRMPSVRTVSDLGTVRWSGLVPRTRSAASELTPNQ
jgi:hypothetical protein